MTHAIQRTSLALIALAIIGLGAANAQQSEPPRDTLYLTTTIRAAPGELGPLIDNLKALRDHGFYDAAQRTPPLIMRHSQGDHWDLMLLEPVGDYAAHFDPQRMNAEAAARADHGDVLSDMSARLAFKDTLLAYGPPAEIMRSHLGEAGLFHIEMFRAAPGKGDELIAQREMENLYYWATERRGNLIFVTDFGSDVDVFTIGGYDSLLAFATDPDLPEEAFENAAIDAGFTARGDIGLYLRSLLSSHQDTLAVSVE